MTTDTKVPQDWSTTDSAELYRVANWGEGYFGIDATGRVEVRPRTEVPGIDLAAVCDAVEAAGLRLPVLARFTDVLGDRIARLESAFDAAIAAADFRGGYRLVYPVKVNQQRTVVEHILRFGEGRVGLEAGSKPEMMAALGVAPAGCSIVCNGYKDSAFVRLAGAAQRLGHQVYLVVEKLSELTDILALAEAGEPLPLIGLRVRLASVATGHWQNTGGDKAKFGLTASQVLEAIEILRGAGRLQGLRMLHVHVGSQVADHAALVRAMRETASLYRALRDQGAPVDCVDVGGGLAVDYEGRRATSFCSMNYGLDDYARLVVSALAEVCEAHELPHPDIVSESGRALTAHHAVLLTEVIDSEAANGGPAAQSTGCDPMAAQAAASEKLEAAQAAFSRGEIGLAERAVAEREAFAAYAAIVDALSENEPEQARLLEALRDKLADKYFCNFSVFQSVPDVWALDQVFPVMPLQRLDERPTRRVRLCDLTCDSDGRMDRYVDAAGVDTTLPLHALRSGERYRLGIFLVGAYQETLGDMHNMFGDTDTVNVEVDGESWRLTEPERGDAADELLRYVHFEPERLRAVYRDKLAASGLSGADREGLEALLEEGLTGYTYLLD